ncbi:MAG: DUF2085 domain-containing protein [bacterium]|nr:DUF2085 domain-containing protein [bacterium]
MELLDLIIHHTGFAVCHQLPSRTFEMGGNAMGLCARCAGLYLGVAATYLYIFLWRRGKVNAIPRLWLSALFVLFILPMAFDGLTSYAGLRETTNDIRIITGALTGCILPIFAFPLQSKQLLIVDEKGVERRDTFRKWYDAAVWGAIVAALVTMGLWHPNFLYYPLSLLTSFALLGIFFNLALVIVELIGEGLTVLKRPWTFLIAALITAIALVFLNVVHWYALQQLLKLTGGVLPE